MTELKPCPECGSSCLNIMIEHCSGNKIIHCMECSRDYHELELTREDKADQVIEKWNAFATNYKPKPKIELKPCPFCGGDAELRDEGEGCDETYAIHCNRCHMHFEKFVWRGYGENTVIKEWNTRVRE